MDFSILDRLSSPGVYIVHSSNLDFKQKQTLSTLIERQNTISSAPTEGNDRFHKLIILQRKARVIQGNISYKLSCSFASPLQVDTHLLNALQATS